MKNKGAKSCARAQRKLKLKISKFWSCKGSSKNKKKNWKPRLINTRWNSRRDRRGLHLSKLNWQIQLISSFLRLKYWRNKTMKLKRKSVILKSKSFCKILSKKNPRKTLHLQLSAPQWTNLQTVRMPIKTNRILNGKLMNSLSSSRRKKKRFSFFGTWSEKWTNNAEIL